MRISGTSNLFFNAQKSTQKSNTKIDFQSSLASGVEKSTANTMVSIISSSTRTENLNLLSNTQIEYLRNRYNSEDMSVLYDEEKGDYMSEEFDNLLNDLYELDILSQRDMEFLTRKFLTPLPLPQEAVEAMKNGNTWGKLERIDEKSSFYKQFFILNEQETWRKDVSNYCRAIADRHLEIMKEYERLGTKPPRLIPYISSEERESGNIPELDSHFASDNWLTESAEVRNHLADVLDQLFKN